MQINLLNNLFVNKQIRTNKSETRTNAKSKPIYTWINIVTKRNVYMCIKIKIKNNIFTKNYNQGLTITIRPSNIQDKFTNPYQNKTSGYNKT